MKKVLIFGMTENPGGVETFLMNYYRKLNSDELHFDFLGATLKKIAYENEILDRGSLVYHLPKRKEHPIKYWKAVHSFFRKHANEYNCIWINLNTLINMDYLRLAKKYGIRKIIIHSHSSQNMDNELKKFIHIYNRKRVAKYATDFWACSTLAAKWFFPRNIQSKVIIIKNAINVLNYQFDDKKRKLIRDKYNLKNSFVIGNVGRLHFEKNQIFSIKVLQEVLKQIPNSKLVLVGQGPDKEKLLDEVKKIGLNDKVIFAGVQHDMAEWYSSFDYFIFPSLFEGLGLAAVEAQANGLPVISANKDIPSELKINSNFEFESLNSGVKVWANKIIKNRNEKRLPVNVIKINFDKHGYDINIAVKKLKDKLME